MKQQLLKYACEIEHEAILIESDTLVSMTEGVRNSILANKYRKIASRLREICDLEE